MHNIETQVPHSTEAEEAVIGAVLINPESFYDVSIPPEDFYIHRNRWCWQAFINLDKRKSVIDFVTIIEELDNLGHLADIGGQAYITKLINAVPSSLHTQHYAEIVKEKATRRRMLSAANEIAKGAYAEGKDINELVANSIRDLDKLSTVSQKGRAIAEVASEVMDTVLERINQVHDNKEIDVGFKTGVGYIDRNLEGLKRKWLVYLAGSPGVGKSMLAFQMALVFAKQAPGDYVALEMDEEGLLYRAYSMRTGETPTDIEFGRVDSNKIINAYSQFEDLPFQVFCPARLSSHELKAYIAKQKAERDIGWVIVDYVSLLETPQSRSKIEEDEHLSAELRKIASEFDILVIGLDSITKSGASGMLGLADVRGSFTKQHDADLSFGMSKYKAMNGIAPEVSIERQRNCRLLQSLKDRHRGTADMIFPLELVAGLVDDLQEMTNASVPDWVHD